MNTPPTSDWVDYDYAIVRIVPQVHLCTFLNVGVILHARTVGFLDTRLFLQTARLRATCPTLDLEMVDRYMDAYRRVCQGAAEGGPIGLLPPSERFHWLTTPRSTVLQTSPVHAGRTRAPLLTLEQLFESHVQGARLHS